MKKVVFAVLLTVPAGMLAGASPARALAQQPQSNIKLDQPEYDAYMNATGQTDPTAEAAALEAFLVKYPNSTVKKTVLEILVTAYQQANQPQKSIDTANRVLDVDPWDMRALVTVAGLDRYLAVQKNPPDQALLDLAAAAATKGLRAVKPMDISAAEFQKEQKDFAPIFEDAKGVAEQNSKNYPDAIRDLTQALKDTPPDQAATGIAPQDLYLLAQSYISQTPSDPLKGAYYYARLASLVPASPDFLKNAKYYYHKYHGKDDGFDTFMATAKANLVPPADLATTVTPAPSPADIANQLVASTPDLASLALSDREFLLVNASQDNADKVWAAMKGKTAEVPGMVISATSTSVQLAVSDDAIQSKTADITIKMTDPLKSIPPYSSQQTFQGTYDSYTKSPFMITLVDGKSTAKPPVKKPVPVHHK